jgi:hypothetical protein
VEEWLAMPIENNAVNVYVSGTDYEKSEKMTRAEIHYVASVEFVQRGLSQLVEQIKKDFEARFSDSFENGLRDSLETVVKTPW